MIHESYDFLVGEQWAPHLNREFQSKYMQDLKEKLEVCYTYGTVYPAKKHIFRAFRESQFDDTRVLILGQDPYHMGNATGLAFDVGSSPSINPSLRNILKEVNDSVGQTQIEKGDLSSWAKQGVLLLNTILTVDKGHPKAHSQFGRAPFIATALNALNFRGGDKPLVVMLWGKDAQRYAHFFNMPNQLVLTAPHPAAEAYSGGKAGFFGCTHFLTANEFLARNGCDPIRW